MLTIKTNNLLKHIAIIAKHIAIIVRETCIRLQKLCTLAIRKWPYGQKLLEMYTLTHTLVHTHQCTHTHTQKLLEASLSLFSWISPCWSFSFVTLQLPPILANINSLKSPILSHSGIKNLIMKTWKTLEDLDHTLETALDLALAAPDLENAKDKTWSKSIFLNDLK